MSAVLHRPRAENFDIVKEIFNGVLESHAGMRRQYHADDGDFITTSMKESAVFQASADDLRKRVGELAQLMNQYSVPFFSPRYIGHMCMEMSVPAIVGYLTTMLFNPNNVAFEASPITTLLELEVGQQLCTMLGYPANISTHDGDGEKITPWGHIACDGTVANMEASQSMWVARNLKYYPLALRSAIDEGMLGFVSDGLKVTPAGPADTQSKLLKDFSNWELLNIPAQEVLSLADRLHLEYGISSQFLQDALEPYLVQSAGKEKMFEKFGVDLNKPPQYLVSSTKHYSWPKSAALVGIGSDNCVRIPVDNLARIDISKLDALLKERLDKKQAVYAVVAIIGSTEEGVVDPLDEVIQLRDKYQAMGLTFIVHADAAWGGYFASMIRDPPAEAPRRWDDQVDEDGSRDFVPSITLRESTVKQFEALKGADSITIDPHKAGYIPYPAGALCYRDGRMRFLVTWTAPYLHDGSEGESIGVYGIEGSKPGAPAAAAYLHHQVIGLHKQGHGGLLGEVGWACRRLSSHWATLSDDLDDFIVVPFNPLVNDGDPIKEKEEKQFIRERIIAKSNEAVIADKEALDELCALGSDLNINAFACNFKINEKVNDDVEDANYLNSRVFDRLSMTKVSEQPQDIPLFLSSTVFGQAEYDECLRNYQRRMGLETDSRQDLFVLRNVVMSPFQGAGNYSNKIAELFKGVLQEEVQIVRDRATVKPETIWFNIFGREKIYLTNAPFFHKASGRNHLVLSADIAGPQGVVYKLLTDNDKMYRCKTLHEVTLDDIINQKQVDVVINGVNLIGHECVTLSNIQVVKERSLKSCYRDQQFSESCMPFYLFGTSQEQHIEHMLLRAPNVQISADRVQLDVQPPLSAAQLAKGVLLQINRPERALQPPAADNPPERMFRRGASFDVTIVDDTKPAVTHGPGLAAGGNQLAKGKVTLAGDVHVDWKDINTEDFARGLTRVTNSLEPEANMQTRSEWKEVVSAALRF
ncbi:PLP-dependent transferase [Mycena albidolilacea]|uniref:PLP-dependent transferase n=1 Tax=Mycena albidolilacea TaxID=1033008 RepID=A0AAD7EHM2_9AGAR|nr:PLP-dependent transferase [Mycena albidolilacea]